MKYKSLPIGYSKLTFSLHACMHQLFPMVPLLGRDGVEGVQVAGKTHLPQAQLELGEAMLDRVRELRVPVRGKKNNFTFGWLWFAAGSDRSE
jgi:hypothetical protein